VTQVTVADMNDLLALRVLNDLCFLPGAHRGELIAPGDLEHGVAAKNIRVAKKGGAMVGFLHYEKPLPDHIYINALGVHPEFRRQGVARKLLTSLLDEATETGLQRSISTVTNPTNYHMLGLLLSCGFIVRTLMKDYFGPGQDRFYCQYKVRLEYVNPDDRYIVPVQAGRHIANLLSSEEYVVTSLVMLPAGPAFEISRLEPDDFAALQSDESASGITFSAGILAAVTFILGFSFASTSYPDDVRILLIGAALTTTISLIVYANASGELSRLRSNLFSHHMKWGNILSEYGGVMPFVISLPVTFMSVARSTWAALITASIFSIVLFVYERSRFAISSRYHRDLLLAFLEVITCSAPLTGVLVIKYFTFTWVWTTLVSLALVVQAAIYLFRRPVESGFKRDYTGWRVRK